MLLLLAGSSLDAAPGSAIEGRSLDPGGRRASVAAAPQPDSLSPTLFASASVKISPDSRYVVYGSSAGLYSRRLPDGQPMTIAPPPPCGNMFESFLITDDAQTVLFTCPAWTGTPKDLWAVPIEGPASAAVLLSTAPDAPYEVYDFSSTTSAARVFYTMPRADPFRMDLFSVPVTGPASASVVINSPLAEGDQVREPSPFS